MAKLNRSVAIGIGAGAIGVLALMATAGRRRSPSKAPTPDKSPDPESPDEPAPDDCPDPDAREGEFAGFKYFQYMTGGASPTDDVPVIYFFHGLGADPSKISWVFKDWNFPSRVIAPRGRKNWSSGGAWWRIRTATKDQQRLADEMQRVAGDVSSFIRSMQACFGRQRKRPIITGHSQGGMLTLAIAAQDNGLARHAISASGWLPELLWPKSLPPTTVIHGTGDEIVSFDRSMSLYNHMEEQRMPVEAIYVEGAGHKVVDILPAWNQAVQRII